MTRHAPELSRWTAAMSVPGCIDRDTFLDIAAAAREHCGSMKPFAIFLIHVDPPSRRFGRLDEATGEHLDHLAALRVKRTAGDNLMVRLGTRRFLVLVPGPIDEFSAVALSGRLHEALRARFDVGEGDTFVTTSIGVGLGERYEDAAVVLEQSERALERVKTNGGDATVVESTRQMFQRAKRNSAA